MLTNLTTFHKNSIFKNKESLLNQIFGIFIYFCFHPAELPPREECKLTEPWFKTRYTVEDISEERRKRWSDPEVIEDFHLPEPNVFIAEDTALKPVPEGNPKYPRKVSGDSPMGEMFHRMDDTFKQPRGHILFHLLSPEAVFRLGTELTPRH